MVGFVIYTAANIGLALQNNYAALMVLRCLQSAGSSGMVALASGVTADIITSAERGAYIGYASVSTIIGPLNLSYPGRRSSAIPWVAFDLLVPYHLRGLHLPPVPGFLPRNMSEGGWGWLRAAAALQSVTHDVLERTEDDKSWTCARLH